MFKLNSWLSSVHFCTCGCHLNLSDKTLLKHRILLCIGYPCQYFLVMENKTGKGGVWESSGIWKRKWQIHKRLWKWEGCQRAGLSKQAWGAVGFSVPCPNLHGLKDSYQCLVCLLTWLIELLHYKPSGSDRWNTFFFCPLEKLCDSRNLLEAQNDCGISNSIWIGDEPNHRQRHCSDPAFIKELAVQSLSAAQ